jgi:lysyl-tRNA synthetase class 2
MDMTEELFQDVLENVCGTIVIRYGEQDLDFSKFERLSMHDAIVKHWPEHAGTKPNLSELKSKGLLSGRLRGAIEELDRLHKQGLHSENPEQQEKSSAVRASFLEILHNLEGKNASLGEAIGDLFEAVAEKHLFQPTFIYDFPTEISPLSKCRADDPTLTERFELFIAGMEIANGFSELNDPADQERRFQAQVAKGGQEMPKEVDSDYIRALSHGLPPTAGEGIGIDRLVMLLTDSHAIREVILFPLLRAHAPESPGNEGAPADSEAK